MAVLPTEAADVEKLRDLGKMSSLGGVRYLWVTQVEMSEF